jgi:hypothetical protein
MLLDSQSEGLIVRSGAWEFKYSIFFRGDKVASDGKRLVWASNRNRKEPNETNISIANWVD